MYFSTSFPSIFKYMSIRIANQFLYAGVLKHCIQFPQLLLRCFMFSIPLYLEIPKSLETHSVSWLHDNWIQPYPVKSENLQTRVLRNRMWILWSEIVIKEKQDLRKINHRKCVVKNHGTKFIARKFIARNFIVG